VSDQRLKDEIMEIASEGFDEGVSAAVDMLNEPGIAQWLANAANLPLERAEAVLAELRGLFAGAVRRA